MKWKRTHLFFIVSIKDILKNLNCRFGINSITNRVIFLPKTKKAVVFIIMKQNYFEMKSSWQKNFHIKLSCKKIASLHKILQLFVHVMKCQLRSLILFLFELILRWRLHICKLGSINIDNKTRYFLQCTKLMRS